MKTFSDNFISDVLTSGQNYVATVDGKHDDPNTDPCKFALKVHVSSDDKVGIFMIIHICVQMLSVYHTLRLLCKC